MEDIRELLEDRQPLYDSAADFMIETTDKSIKKIVQNIITKLNHVGFF